MNFKYIVIYSSYSKRKKRKKINSKELWNLDITIIEWLVPRLKAFREQTEGYPGDITEEEWDNILDKIITGLEAYKAEHDWDDNISKKENMECAKIFYADKNAKFQEAMRLLAKHFKKVFDGNGNSERNNNSQA